MNKKILSLISAFALTASTVTAFTSNALTYEDIESFIKIEENEDRVLGYYRNFDNYVGLYMDCLDNDKDGLSYVYDVRYCNNRIILNKPESISDEDFVNKIKNINEKYKVSNGRYALRVIESTDENEKRIDFTISEVKALMEMFKDESYEFKYVAPHYGYSYYIFAEDSPLSFNIDMELEKMENYIKENQLDYKIEIPKNNENGIFHLIPDKELTDLEYLYLAEKLYREADFHFQSLSPEEFINIPSYVIENSLCLNGDSNCDNELTLADSVAVMQSLGNPDKYALSMEGVFNAEVDGIEGITVNDASVIRQWGIDKMRTN